MRRLRLVLASVAVSWGMAAATFAGPAEATPVDFTCTVNGNGTANPSVGLQANTGSYSTGWSGPCELTWANGATDTADLSVTSTGTYSNVSCGTMTWDGTNTGGSLVSRSGSASTNSLLVGKDLSYFVDFRGFLGDLVFKAPGQPLHPGTASAVGGGLITFVPSSLPTNGVCASGFASSGVWNFELDGAPPPFDPVKDVEDLIPDDVLAPEDPSPPTGYPSAACAAGVPLAPVTGPDNSIRESTYVWKESDTKVSVCERVHAGGVASAGGRLEIDLGSGAVMPTWTTSTTDMSPCTSTLGGVGPPADVTVKWSGTVNPPNVTNPVSVCLITDSAQVRVTAGTSGSAAPPQICWSSDPDPGSRTCKP